MERRVRAHPLCMMVVFKIALWIHVVAGTVALSVFWLPLVTKKGGLAHRRVGWVYVVAAGTIALTAFIRCAKLLTDANPANDRAGIFLAYIGVLAWANAQLGVRALRSKGRTTASRDPIDLLPPVLLVAGGVALAAYALREGVVLFGIFAALGMTLGTTQLRFWLRAPATRTAWFLAHMSGMGGSCITTVTAFLVVNAHNFGLGTFNIVVWVAPGMMGGVGLSVWRRYYERRFDRGASSAPAQRGAAAST